MRRSSMLGILLLAVGLVGPAAKSDAEVSSLSGEFVASPLYAIGGVQTSGPNGGIYEFAIHKSGPADSFEGFKVVALKKVFLHGWPQVLLIDQAVVNGSVIGIEPDPVYPEVFTNLSIKMTLPNTGSWDVIVKSREESSPVIPVYSECAYQIVGIGGRRFRTDGGGASASGTINGEPVSDLHNCDSFFGFGDSGRYHFHSISDPLREL